MTYAVDLSILGLEANGSAAAITANATGISVILVGNSTVNTVIDASTISIGNSTVVNTSSILLGNSTVVNTSAISIGNSTVNTIINSTARYFYANTTNYNYVNATTISTGNSTVNTTINATTISTGNSTVYTAINATSINVGSILVNGNLGTNGQILLSNGTGTAWSNPPYPTYAQMLQASSLRL
jgi:hypothetical protein